MRAPVGWLLAALATLVGVGCAEAPIRVTTIQTVEVAPEQLAILPVEDREAGGTADHQLREALTRAAIDAGFAALARDYVDRQAIDLDVPGLGEAGILRVRLLEWEAQQGPPARLVGRVHASLYQEGQLLTELIYPIERRADASIAAADGPGQLEALEAAWAKDLIARLPAPPAVDRPE